MASSTAVVLAALVANGAIAVMKFAGFLLTGSPAMLSETYHSISDTGNQVLLLVGIHYGRKDPTAAHPFGFGKAQFFYPFLVAVLLFGIAGWESARHGYHALTHGGRALGGEATLLGYTVPAVWVNYAVLTGAIGFEAWALSKAHANMSRQITEYRWDGFREAFRRTSDLTTLTALVEDTVAMAGAAIALAGVALTEYTGDPVYDALAALLIGLLLMGFALGLAWEAKRLLLGESLPPRVERRLERSVADVEGVDHVDQFRSVFFGPHRALVFVEASFDPDLDAGTLDVRIGEIQRRLREVDDRIELVHVEPEV